MKKLKYDDLLGEYVDSDGEIYDGIVEVEISENGFEAYTTDIQDNLDNHNYLKEQEKVVAIEKSIANYKQQIDLLENQKRNITDAILKQMQDKDIWKIELDGVTITRTKSYERRTIDSKKLKEDMPDIAKMYENTSIVGESIKIKLGGTNNGI